MSLNRDTKDASLELGDRSYKVNTDNTVQDQDGQDAKGYERHDQATKVYKRRWYILGLYVLYMVCNSSQWLQYSIISSVTVKFYGVTNWHVNLTSLVMMGCYLPLALPAANLMDRITLRWTAILGASGTALGSWIKVASASPERFYVTLTGQTVVAVFQVLMLSVPQKLSSIWFGDNEVSSACSIGVFGFQLGIVVGFFLPPILVKDHADTDVISDDFFRMFLYFAVTSTVIAVLVIISGSHFGHLFPYNCQWELSIIPLVWRNAKSLRMAMYELVLPNFYLNKPGLGHRGGVWPNTLLQKDEAHAREWDIYNIAFQAEPRLPPTLSQARCRKSKHLGRTSYVQTLKRLLTQRHLVGLFLTTGVNNGCFNGLSTLLSQIVLDYFPGAEEDAGRIGVVLVVFGMTGSIVFGAILDKTKKFKLILLFIYYMSAVGMTVFTVVLSFGMNVWILYFVAGFLGTFLCGFTAISFDVATELTYPESELIVGTIMNMSSLFFTFATTLAFGFINESVGYIWGNVGFIVVLFVGATCMLPIKFEHKRTNSQTSKCIGEEQRFVVNT